MAGVKREERAATSGTSRLEQVGRTVAMVMMAILFVAAATLTVIAQM